MIPTTCRLFTNELQHLETETEHPVYTPPDCISPSTPSSKIVGVLHPYGNTILICEENCVNVGFRVTNQFRETVDCMLVQYKNPQTGTAVCEAFKNIHVDWFAEFTSNYMKNAKISVVIIAVVDSSFSDNDAAPLPNCCGDNEVLGEIHATHAGINTVNTVRYTYVLDCCVEETKCV
jgi:hypothetical protein